ncbi:hypothetical protein [Oscillatoria salina]|uniref:hypothetical protein n=1 Tax=Oscillatoria salina TaxID=331517 RepID=UPI001CCB1115|nr:hypothetical protein [Oscillatoria salina]MBZ8183304.1 hypothetical protein [Oscillatoria salina IIICB1]
MGESIFGSKSNSGKQRHHIDPPKLWIGAIAGSIIIHAIAFFMLRSLLFTEKAAANVTQTAIPIELVTNSTEITDSNEKASSPQTVAPSPLQRKVANPKVTTTASEINSEISSPQPQFPKKQVVVTPTPQKNAENPPEKQKPSFQAKKQSEKSSHSRETKLKQEIDTVSQPPDILTKDKSELEIASQQDTITKSESQTVTQPVEVETNSDSQTVTQPVEVETNSDSQTVTQPVEVETNSDSQTVTQPVEVETNSDSQTVTQPVEVETNSDSQTVTQPVETVEVETTPNNLSDRTESETAAGIMVTVGAYRLTDPNRDVPDKLAQLRQNSISVASEEIQPLGINVERVVQVEVVVLIRPTGEASVVGSPRILQGSITVDAAQVLATKIVQRMEFEPTYMGSSPVAQAYYLPLTISPSRN